MRTSGCGGKRGKRGKRARKTYPSTSSSSVASSRSSSPGVPSAVLLIVVLSLLGLRQIRRARRFEVNDLDVLVFSGRGNTAHSVDTNLGDAELVLPEDITEGVERRWRVEVKVEDRTKGLLERLIGEAADVASEGKKLTERKGVGESAGGELGAEVLEGGDELLEEFLREVGSELGQDAKLAGGVGVDHSVGGEGIADGTDELRAGAKRKEEREGRKGRRRGQRPLSALSKNGRGGEGETYGVAEERETRSIGEEDKAEIGVNDNLHLRVSAARDRSDLSTVGQRHLTARCERAQCCDDLRRRLVDLVEDENPSEL